LIYHTSFFVLSVLNFLLFRQRITAVFVV